MLVNLNLTNKLVGWKFYQLSANLPPVLGRIQDSRCKDFIPSLYSGQKTERDEKRFSAPLEKRLRAQQRDALEMMLRCLKNEIQNMIKKLKLAQIKLLLNMQGVLVYSMTP